MPGSLKASNSTKRIIDKYNLSKSHTNLATHFDEQEAQNNIALLDYFGFYHPDGLTHRDREAEHKYRKKDVKRVDKWMKFIQNNGFDSFYKGKPNEELIRRVFKGIPPRIRPRVWPILLNVASAKKDRVYDDMRKYAFVSSTYIEQIDLDINRTFRSTTFFNESFGPRQQVLFRILAAYSMYNTEVGYCQGMSDIAGMLLIYIMDEEEAFWALAQLLDGPRHKMHCLFVRDFPGLRRYFTHHERVLKTHLRKVWKHFRKEQVDTSTYALKWYMQCFLGRLPISLTLRIWDIYLLEGEKAMVAMAYNILKMHKQRLLRMDQMQILTFLQDEISKDFGFADDDVIDSLKDCLEDLRRSHTETPPPLTPDMLPTKPMGQPPAIWEVRHSDEEDQSKTEQRQQKNSSQSWKSKGEDSGVGIIVSEEDGILRSDHPISPCTTTSSAGKAEVRLRKPVNASNSTTAGSKSQHSPFSTDSRRRLRGSQQSMNSARSVITSPRISTDITSIASANPHHSLSEQHRDSCAPKTNTGDIVSTTTSTPASIRRVKNGKMPSPIQTLNITRVDPGALEDSENVWFVPSGTGYISSSGTYSTEDRKDTKRVNPNDDLNLPPRDYKSEATDSDPNSPWTQAKPPHVHHKSRQDTSSNEKAVVVIHKAVSSKDPSTQNLRDPSPLWTKNPSSSSSSPQHQSGVTKIANARFYATHVQRPVSSGCGPAFPPKSGNSSIVFPTGSGEMRWSVHGAVSAFPFEMQPRICSPLHSSSPSPRSYQFQQYQ